MTGASLQVPVGGASGGNGVHAVGVRDVDGVPGADGRVGLVGEDRVVGVHGAGGERHYVALGLIGLVLEGAAPHDLAHVLAALVDVAELLAAGGVVVLVVERQALGLLENVEGGAGADSVQLACLVPAVAVGRLDGHGLDLPAVVAGLGAVGRGAVRVLAPLAHVLVALVEAALLDEVLLALGAQRPASVDVVALAVESALLGLGDAAQLRRKERNNMRVPGEYRDGAWRDSLCCSGGWQR
mmetsp:Transcript_18492/g.45995  ORF Transcript_18492/g.45995 Transcript_18492/m.45995 type:complete len:241 (+) Transcript_18492:475-1197(+)